MNDQGSDGEDDGRELVTRTTEEPTAVRVAEDFAVGAIKRLSGGLERAGRRVGELADLVPAVAGVAALDEVITDLGDLLQMIQGARRASIRLRSARITDEADTKKGNR